MNIRNIVTEKWNQEIIWANSNSIIGQLQDHAIPRGLEPGKEGNASVGGNLAVPLKIADLFYTKMEYLSRKIKPGTMMIA